MAAEQENGDLMSVHTQPRYAWMDGEFVDWTDARLHVDTLAVQGGLNVYEVIGAFRSEAEEQLFLFRPEVHMRRMQRSSKVMRLHIPFTPDQLVAGALELLRRNEILGDAGVRIVLHLGAGALFHFEPADISTGVFMIARTVPASLRRPPIHVGTSRWVRLDDMMAPPRVKSGANYQNARLAQVQAHVDGYDDAVLLNAAGKVCELPLANLFLVLDGRLVTPAKTTGILEGITRQTVLELVRAADIEVEERVVDRSELYTADEIFATGSLSGVTPILSVDRLAVGDGSVGPTTLRWQQTLEDANRHVHSPAGWCMPVYAPVSNAPAGA